MAYIDYEYYTDRFKGNTIPLADFEYVAPRAEDYINYITNGRITEPTVPVQNACCAVADKLYTMDAREGIQSETTDGYSVTYRDGEGLPNLLYGAAEVYLAGTGLLYRGVCL